MGQPLPGLPPRRRSSGVGSSSTPASPSIYTGHGRHGDVPPGSPASSTAWSEDGSEGKAHRVPGFAVTMQSTLLKRISSYRTKESLLEFVASYHCLLDPINLVTCLYRLAKMSFSSRSRNAYLTELQRSPTFQLLLRSISAQFLHSQLLYLHHHIEPKGVDARCLANLVWALAKLDLSSDDGALSTEIALNVAPFVLRSLNSCSPQGLANILWSYAKLPVAPPAVVAALVAKIATELSASLRAGGDDCKPFDAQALSNSIWALAHLKTRGMEVEAFGDALVAFLEAVALAATRMLTRLQAQLLALPRPPGGAPDASALLAAAEADFSCQALVNICWALATVVGPACATHGPFRQLFAVANVEAVGRLRATAALLAARQPLPYHGGGGGQGFNEQALSNAVYAFDRAGLLSHNLLSAILEVATLRLAAAANAAGDGGHAPPLGFKPQELCTLLKACHSGAAPPWGFLGTLLRLLSINPAAVDNWSTAEKAELQRAYLLYHQHALAQAAAAQGAAADAALLAHLGLLEAQQQVQQEGGAAQQQQAAALAAALAALQQRQAATQQQEALSAMVAAAAAAQQQPAGSGGGAAAAQQQRAIGAAARPPPAPYAFGGPRASSSGPVPATPPPGATPTFGASLFDPSAGGGFSSAMHGIASSSAGTSPRTPASQHSAAGGAAGTLPGLDQATNKSQRARLAHAPAQQQALLFAQTQQRLAGEGLSTSTAGSLWPGAAGGGDGGNTAAAAPRAGTPPLPPGLSPRGGGPAAVDAAKLRPWLLDAAAAAAAGGAAPRF